MTGRSDSWDVAPVIAWLLSAGRFSQTLDDLSGSMGQQLVAIGAPVWRLRLGTRTLHPMIAALSGAWERDAGVLDTVQAPHGLESRSSYVGSPLQIIAETRQPFRRNLSQPLHADDHVVLQELKDRGATDYLGLPLQLTSSPGGIMVLVSDHPGGFTDSDIDQLTQLADPIALLVEVIRLKHETTAITGAYLGPRSAARVLSGQITRGHVETIRAAILFSDIRGWTAINTRLPPTETVAIANRYFDVLTDAVTAHGGEVLKLMGDGILAIFAEDDSAAACKHALSAALAAQARAAEDPEFDTRFGIAMHVGDVLYGNVGSENRLDFTVLGAAVNFAARIEGLCAKYDRDILYSRAFADHLDAPSRLVGTETLKGLDAPQEVLAPD